MRRLSQSIIVSALLTAFFAFSFSSLASAQEEEMSFDEDEAAEGEMTFDEDESAELEKLTDESEPEPELEDGEPEPEELDPDGDSTSGDLVGNLEEIAWQDIVVVVRKPFLKVRRVELTPSWGMTMNDNIIRHYQFAAQLNYYLTDVLAVGLEGQYYIEEEREPFDLVALQARRLPTVNKYNFGAAINFHYVPIYGKFAVLDEHIVHWETAFTAGVGWTQSEVKPRDPAHQEFTNNLITPNIGASMRFFINRFLTVNIGIRDYVFVDKFEAASRMDPSASAAKADADSALVNNVFFQAGISIWFPMSFEYTTFR